jgi:hypothetical protein
MPKFRIYAAVSGTKYLGEFEGNTKEEALAEAGREAFVSLCHQCDSECEDAEIHEMTAEEIKK